MDKTQLFRTLQDADAAWQGGAVEDAHRMLWRLLDIRDAGRYPEYKELDRAISRLFRQAGIRDEGRSVASALWTACKVLDEGEQAAYPMGLINLGTVVSLLQRSLVMSDLAQIQTPATHAARAANARTATAHRVAGQTVKPCDCGGPPHMSRCPVYQRNAARKSRERRRAAGAA